MVERGATYSRIDLDDYATPVYVVRAIVSHLHKTCYALAPCVVDPCAGTGNVVKSLQKAGYATVGLDIKRNRFNFLYDEICAPEEFDILTNPPYGVGGRLALRFVERALDVTKPWMGKVVMLLPADFDSGVTRQPVFNHPAFAHKVILTRRIKWFDGQSGSTNHAWYVWDWKHSGSTTLSYMEGGKTTHRL